VTLHYVTLRKGETARKSNGLLGKREDVEAHFGLQDRASAMARSSMMR
jgi:hypothetical protein